MAIHEINDFWLNYRPNGLVVCCRLDEYQSCNTKLTLNGAVYLQPLTDEQILSYVETSSHPELWCSIRSDSALLELARSPMLLSIITLAHAVGSIQEWQQFSRTQERDRYLFNAYIERMLSRKSKGKQYTKEKTLHWLAWLAKTLKAQAQTDFLIEKLQPRWLGSFTQRCLYRIAVVLLVSLALGMSHLLRDLSFSSPKEKLLLAFDQKARDIMGGAHKMWMDSTLPESLTYLFDPPLPPRYEIFYFLYIDSGIDYRADANNKPH